MSLIDVNCTFTMSGTYSFQSDSVYAAWKKAQGYLSLPAQREYVSDSLEIDSLNQCMVANGWDPEEIDELSCMTADELTREIFRRDNADLGISGSWKAKTKRMKKFLLDYYGTHYTPPTPTQPQPKQSSPKKEVFAVLCAKNSWMDVKVFDSIAGAKEYVSNCFQAEKYALSKQGFDLEVISDEGLRFAQIFTMGSNIHRYWRIVQTDLDTKAVPDSPSPAPQPVAVEQNKPPVVPTDIRIETSKGALIAREDPLSHGVWVDLRRPNANDDLPLAL